MYFKNPLLLSFLPLFSNIYWIVLFIKTASYRPTPSFGTHGNLGYSYEYLFAAISLVFIVLNLTALYQLYKRTKSLWFIYGLNLVTALVLVITAYSYISSYFYSKANAAVEMKEKQALHQLDNAWQYIDDKKKVLHTIEGVEPSGSYSTKIPENITALKLALKIKDIKSSSKKIDIETDSYTCKGIEILLNKIPSQDEEILISLINYGPKGRDKTDCIPSGLFTYDTLIEQKKFNILMALVQKTILSQSYIEEVLVSFMKIEETDIQEKLIKLALNNFTYYRLNTFSSEIKSILRLADSLELLERTKAFEDYTNILHEVSVKESKRHTSYFYEVEEYEKEEFLRLHKVLGKDNALLHDIPKYIREHFLKEDLIEKDKENYFLYENFLKYNDEHNRTMSYGQSNYNLYLEEELVYSSKSGYYGYIRQWFRISDANKEVTVKYLDYEIVETLRYVKPKFRTSAFDYQKSAKYWIHYQTIKNQKANNNNEH